MSIILQDGFLIGADDLFSEATPHLYSHLIPSLDAGNEIIVDQTGNGHDFTWDTRGANATTTAAGIWVGGELQWPVTAIANNCFISKAVGEYPFHNTEKSSVYVYHINLPANVVGTSSLICCRGGAGSSINGGFHNSISVTNNLPNLQLHDGISALNSVSQVLLSPLTAVESSTVAFMHDATANELSIIEATDTTIVQYKSSAKLPVTLSLDYSLSTQVAALGARSYSLPTAEVANNMILKSARCYHDVNGGSLPSNMADIVRWLHQHPNANIPAKWWP